jgi:hypothetical protein
VNLKLLSVLAAGLLSAAPAYSATVTLDFEGTSSFASVADFYSGLDVSFGLDALGISNDAAGPYFSNAPTPGAVMTAVGPSAAMNVAHGFKGSASFFYSATENTSVSVYSGLDGTGDLLGTVNLVANAQNGGCSDSPFCFWSLATLDFAGVAQSLQFGSAASVAGFDNVTFTSAVPLPAAAWLMMSALGGLGAFARRKRV